MWRTVIIPSSSLLAGMRRLHISGTSHGRQKIQRRRNISCSRQQQKKKMEADVTIHFTAGSLYRIYIHLICYPFRIYLYGATWLHNRCNDCVIALFLSGFVQLFCCTLLYFITFLGLKELIVIPISDINIGPGQP